MANTWNDPRLGYKVHKRAQTPQLDLNRFRDFSTANISDVLGKILTLDYRIKPVSAIKETVIGFAVTVQVHPGDNLMIFKAMELAHPGDIIVISDQYDTNNALIGGVMAEMAAAKNVGAFVTDGLVRDAEELEASGVPLFARGLTPMAPVRGGPLGQVNTTICCGGVIVQPGDIIMGDRSGVVVIPAADAELVIERGKQLLKKEWDWLHPQAAGDFALYKSSHEAIVGQGCELDPGC